MGWTILYNKPTNAKQYMDSLFTSTYLEVLDSAIVNVREYYAAVKSTQTDSVAAVVCMLETSHGEFRYKDMDETMGPLYHNCPARILDKLTPTDSMIANQWRITCRAMLAKKARAAKLKTGDVIKLKSPLKFNNGKTWDTFMVKKSGATVTFEEVTTKTTVKISKWKTREFFLITGTLS